MKKPQERKNPKAVALRYDQDKEQAPRVVAKGEGEVAAKILATAQAHQIPVCPDPLLVEMLAQLDIGKEIPPELYEIVAEVLAFVYFLDRQTVEDRGEQQK